MKNTLRLMLTYFYPTVQRNLFEFVYLCITTKPHSMFYVSRYLRRHDLILWPTFRLSFPEIHSGRITNELVFTRPTMTTNCHMTHTIVPIISDDDHKRHHVVKKNSPRSPTKNPMSPTKHPTSPTKFPFSPTKHPHSPSKHPHSPTKLSLIKSPSTTAKDTPDLHSPTKVKSPTKHHHSGTTGSGGHHRAHSHHHTHHHHHHHHKHHSKHGGEPEVASIDPASHGSISSSSEHERTRLTSDSHEEENRNKKGSHSTSKINNRTIHRKLQLTSPPKFLLAYVPKVKYH